MGPSRKTLRGARLPRHHASNVALCQRSCIHRRKVKRLIWKCFHFWKLPFATSLLMEKQELALEKAFPATKLGLRSHALTLGGSLVWWVSGPLSSSQVFSFSLHKLQQVVSIFWWQKTETCSSIGQTWWTHGDQGFCFNCHIWWLKLTFIFNILYTYGVPWILFPYYFLNSLPFLFGPVQFSPKWWLPNRMQV